MIFVDGSGIRRELEGPPPFRFPYITLPYHSGPVVEGIPYASVALWRPSSLTAVDEEAAAYLRDVSAQYVAYVVAHHL